MSSPYLNYAARRLADPSLHGRNKAEHQLWRDVFSPLAKSQESAAQWPHVLTLAESTYEAVVRHELLLRDNPAPILQVALLKYIPPQYYPLLKERGLITLDEAGFITPPPMET